MNQNQRHWVHKHNVLYVDGRLMAIFPGAHVVDRELNLSHVNIVRAWYR